MQNDDGQAADGTRLPAIIRYHCPQLSESPTQTSMSSGYSRTGRGNHMQALSRHHCSIALALSWHHCRIALLVLRWRPHEYARTCPLRGRAG